MMEERVRQFSFTQPNIIVLVAGKSIKGERSSTVSKTSSIVKEIVFVRSHAN